MAQIFSSDCGGKPDVAWALWRIEGNVRAKKMHQDDGAEFISASVALLSHIYNISAACLAQTVHDGKPETDRTRALGEE